MTSTPPRLTLVPQTSGVVVAAAGGAEGADTRGNSADGDGAGRELGGVATRSEFQRLVTVAVQKGIMDMSDARVRICIWFGFRLSCGIRYSILQGWFMLVFRLFIHTSSHISVAEHVRHFAHLTRADGDPFKVMPSRSNA